jgi:putative hydroxymethylpyrimidine transport system permease protein
MSLLRGALIAAGLLALWELAVHGLGIAPYLLPAPSAIAEALASTPTLFSRHLPVTALEIVLGMLLGATVGLLTALLMTGLPAARRWLLPVLVVSQALPVFAVAPLLVLWLGYGLPARIAMATLIIYFPVTVAAFDGMRAARRDYADLARVMNARAWPRLRLIELPGALPSLASGLRIAAAVAPIGAVVGEWVGAGAGLGHFMLQAIGRARTVEAFAALFLLMLLALAVYGATSTLAGRLVPWRR